MADKWQTDLTIRYTVYGVLTGLLFSVLSFFIQATAGIVPVTLTGIKHLHNIFPAQYLFDGLVLAGGLAGYFISRLTWTYKSRINQLLSQDKEITGKTQDFINKLTNNELDAEIQLKESYNSLQESLVHLRNFLKNNISEENKRKTEDSQRSWISEGLAKFGEILRRDVDNMGEFAFNLISHLVKYLNANQGGFFLVEFDDKNKPYFDMKACYAFDRRKFTDRVIEWGEGIVGTCGLEKQSIYMTDIPENYLTITSGLGHSNPKNLLLVPLMVQDDLFGVVELASFNPIKSHEIEFVENIAESIAITISSVKSNIRTAELLRESQQQAEILASQEEKNRQSMQELRDTQEQAAKQAEKFISFTNSVNHTLIRAEYDTEGILQYANTLFLRKLGFFSNSEVEGKHISMFLDNKDREWFDEIWKRLAEGGKHYEGYMKHMTKTGQDLWTMSTYTCVRKDDGSVDKILFLAIDTTEHKKQSLDYEGQIEAINRLNIKAEFAPDGKFINCNELFIDTFKYTMNELEGMSVFDFIDKKELESFNELWENVTKGIPYQGQIKSFTKYEDEKWFRAAYTAVNDMYGEVAKVIYLGNEITNEKLMEIESRKQTDQLRLHEEKLRLNEIELKKRLEQSREELENQYREVLKERDRFEQSLDTLHDIVLSIDQLSHILYINKTGEKFWNVKLNQVRGKNATVLFPGYPEEYDTFIVSFLSPESTKITGEIKHVKLAKGKGKWIDVEMLLSIAETEQEVSYTAFIRT